MRIIFLTIFIVSLTGCASITQGTSQTLSFKLEPKETKCVLNRVGDGELGSISASSSTILVHKDKDDIIVQCTAPGYTQKTTRIVSGATTAGVTGVLLDFGITDMITGAMYAYPTDITIVMEKESLVISNKQAEQSNNLQQANSTQTVNLVTQTKEEKLKEIKRLNDAGLISKEVYLAKQQEIINNP